MRWQLNFGIGLAALLLSVVPVPAQVGVGDNTSLSLSGDLSFGYSGEYGDNSGSNHGIAIGGQGLLGGYYYNPNFLSFRVQPYYNRSQNNSTSTSISDSSGVVGELDFFRGSHFPGTVAYSKTFASSGQFGVPGSTGFTSHGGGQTLGVTWSEAVPDWPTLTASYSADSEHSQIYGTSGENHGVSHIFNLQSIYTIHDFRLTGQYLHQSQDASFPEVVDSQAATDSNYGTDSTNLQVSHKTALNGQWQMGWTHTSFDGDTHSGDQSSHSDGSNNLFDTGLTLNPVRKLTLAFTTNYNTNVYATLQQQVLQAGGEVSRNRDWSSSALSLNGFAFYTVNSHIALTGSWGRQTQFFDDGSRSIQRYAGSVNSNFNHKFLGSFYFSLGLVDLANEQGNQGVALVGNVSFARRVNGWELGSGFSYSQYVQTLLVTDTTSSYNYNFNFRRRFRNGMYWSGAFLASHSGLAKVEGMSNRAESVNTAFLMGRFTVNATYTQSGGTSIFTPSGVVPVPGGVPGDLVAQLSHYGSKGFGFGGGATMKRWVATINYSKSNGDLVGGNTASIFESRSLNARLQYRVRKMYFNSGFTRFHQNFGAAGSQPVDFNTYFVGFTRWFNVF